MKLKQRLCELKLVASDVGRVGKQRRKRRQMYDPKTRVIYCGFGKYPKGFEIKRAVPV